MSRSAAKLAAGLLAAALAWLLAGCATQPVRPGTAPGYSSDTVSAPGAGPGSRGMARGGDTASKAPAAGPGAASAPAAGAGAAAGKAGRPPGGAGDSLVIRTAPSPAPPRTEPLVMENADRMEGFRSRGEYILSGRVVFTHGPLRLETERAVWLKDRSLIYAESGMRIVHRGAVLTSDRGSYDKNLGQATAEGRVRMRDSTGEMEAEGGNITYLRFRHEATLKGNPVVRRIYRKPPDSVGAAGAASAGPITDTLAIRGNLLTYNDSAQVATAEGDVVITRKQMNITCRRAEYRDRTDSLYLSGEPAVKVDESRVTGVTMRVGMDGEEIKSLLVKGSAKATSVEPATDSTAARESDISGDSLFMAFRDKSIDSVQVFTNAKGSYFESDKPAYVNKMSGEYMVLRFVEKKINSANVLGGAKSTYYHVERKTFKGRNEAEGDTIDFAFKDGKVEEVMVRGKAKGTYFGNPSTGKGGPDSAAAPDAGKPSVDTVGPAGAAAAPGGGRSGTGEAGKAAGAVPASGAGSPSATDGPGERSPTRPSQNPSRRN